MPDPRRGGPRSLVRIEALALLVVTLLGSTATFASGYNETDHEDSSLSTHQFIMDQLPQIWENDGHAELAALLRDGGLSDLKRGTIRADQDLWDRREHYMDPSTHAGLLFFTAAGDLAESQVAQAETAWRAGDRPAAVFHLGWAMHLVQDLTVPHHARLSFLDYHMEYEAWVLAHQSELPVATAGIYDLPAGPSGHHGNSSRPFDWVDYAAHQSWGLLGGVDGVDGTGDNDYRAVAAQMVPLAEQLSAGFLYRMLERVNAPPIADAGPDATTRVGRAITLDARASWDDVAIRGYAWDLPAGRVTGVTANFVPLAEGAHAIPLTVTDVFGRTATDFVRVTARALPTLDLPPLVIGRVGEPVGILATLSTGETPIAVEWIAPTWRDTGVLLTRAFEAPGETRIDVAVTLDDGVVVDGSVLLRIVDDVEPLAAIAAPDRAVVGETVTFDGSGSTDDVAVVSYRWLFGDGATGDGPIGTHAFHAPGTHIVTLEVFDAAGNRGLASHTILVATPAMAGDATGIDVGVITLAALAIGVGSLAVIARRRRRRDRDPP